MNKTDRMLAILLRLQRSGTLRAEDLAETFETSVRTIYRDMQALSEAGVPLLGPPGSGYSLMEGYFLPPVMLTADEALAALIGADFTARHFGGRVRLGSGSFREKIEAVLPPDLRRDVEQLRETTRLLIENVSAADEEEFERTELLRRAVLERRNVRFGYTKAGDEAPTAAEAASASASRTVSPYGLVWMRGAWMLIAYCHAREAIRHFRVSRMERLAALDETFRLPDDFRLSDYRAPDDRSLRATVRANAAAARMVREQRPYYLESAEADGADWRLHFRMRRNEDLLPLLLSLGSSAEVIEPPELRERLREELRSMLKRY